MAESNVKSVNDVEELALAQTIVLSDEERKKYTFKAPFPQEFSFPSNIIYYISRNPAFPNGHSKLISSCKSLLQTSRILPVEILTYDHEIYHNCCNCHLDTPVLIDLKNLRFKLWIVSAFSMWEESLPNICSTLAKHIFKFSLKVIHIEEQFLTIEEVEILVSHSCLKSVYFENTVVKNGDGSITEFGKIFELLCCKQMDINLPDEHHGVGTNTTNKLIEVLSSARVQDAPLEINLLNIPQILDLTLFANFLKSNMINRQHSFGLYFSDEISDDYKNQLQEFVNEIIQLRGIYGDIVPHIHFRDHDIEAYGKLWKMRYESIS